MAALAKYGDLVAEAFDGTVESGDRSRNAGIEALASIGALKPTEEDRYRLNPRLREFIADHLVSYRAFTALTRLAGPISQLQQQWNELKRSHRSGLTREAERLEVALEETVDDIAYTIRRNLALLQSMVSTQYGNVASLQSKLNQNRYYAREVELSLREVSQVDARVSEIASDALAAGLPHIRQLVTRRLGARLLEWSSSIKDAQGVISKRLFEARLLEQNLKRMARYALWLARNRTQDGFEVEVKQDLPAALVRPEVVALRPQPAIQSLDAQVQEVLQEVARKLPPKKRQSEALPEDARQPVLALEMESEEQPLEPHEAALEALVDHLLAHPESVRLSDWRVRRPELKDVPMEPWLLYASHQLRGAGFEVHFRGEPTLDRFPVNESFFDIEVDPKRQGVVG